MSDNGPAGSWHGPAAAGSTTYALRLPAPPRWRSVLSDWATMAGRSLRMARRNLDVLVTSLLLPVLLMVLFVYLFGGAIETGTRYVTYVVPGVLLLSAGFGVAMTAVSVTNDMTGGIIDRFRSLDVAGASILAGHVAASVIRNLASTVLVLAVAFAIGFRPSAGPLDWLAALGVLVLFIGAISWLSAAVGLLARSPEAAGGFSFLVMFLPYPSSAFVPIQTMPTWLHGVAANQPVTPVIETLRGLLLGTPVGSSPWKALAWSLGILVASVAVSGVLFRRRTA
jgi:ABC-2 type transport system permease protein